jgi:hypothetical protein
MDIIHLIYTEHILQTLHEKKICLLSIYVYKVIWQLTHQHLAYICVSIIGNKLNQNLFFLYMKITDGRSSHLGLRLHIMQLEKKRPYEPEFLVHNFRFIIRLFKKKLHGEKN